jgi:hypothetical protein
LAKAVRSLGQPTNAAYIFLSHSHLDKALAQWASNLFDMYEQTVYVDWWDEKMPPRPDATTAARLREKIRNPKSKFVFLATENALDSEWAAWELGYADGTKHEVQLAAFPVAADPATWHGSEYMQLYPSIRQDGDSWSVLFPDGTPLSLDAWLTADAGALADARIGHALRSLLLLRQG